MSEASALPPFAAIIVAAGKGLRAGGDTPKQFAQYRGKPLIRHSAEALLAAGCEQLVILIPEDGEDKAQSALIGLSGFNLVIGGETRQQSVRNGLESLASSNSSIANVLIHDAARPDLPLSIIMQLRTALLANSGVIPVLPVVDSLAVETDGQMAGTANREALRRVQTPQAFRFADILKAHRAWSGPCDAGDDAQVMLANGGKIALLDGDERLKKMTFAQDLRPANQLDNQQNCTHPPMRVGTGFDVHRLVADEELWLCGLKIDHDKGLAGHSDADVALHCVVDALLGAIGEGDIGTHFPPSDPQWNGAASPLFLEHAVKLVARAGYRVGNVDLTIICEEPKIGPHRDAMRKNLAELLQADQSLVSVKATTTERLGFTGRGEGIAAQAIVSIIAL